MDGVSDVCGAADCSWTEVVASCYVLDVGDAADAAVYVYGTEG